MTTLVEHNLPQRESLEDVRAFLQANLSESFVQLFGVDDAAYVRRVTDQWFRDEENYDSRWSVIAGRCPKSARILDMAAGCGTFLLHGLNLGYDVTGVEPEDWKRDYFRRKIAASSYPSEFSERLIPAFGEALPFADESFDLVTSYQTVEHVQDVRACIHEMLRITRPGGVVWIKAPDYNSFYEGHYRLPFLPCMDRRLASWYLRMLGRPPEGLSGINYITEKWVLKCIEDSPWQVQVEGTKQWFAQRRRPRIRQLLPGLFRRDIIVDTLNAGYNAYRAIASLRRFGRAEGSIDFWITKGPRQAGV